MRVWFMAHPGLAVGVEPRGGDVGEDVAEGLVRVLGVEVQAPQDAVEQQRTGDLPAQLGPGRLQREPGLADDVRGVEDLDGHPLEDLAVEDDAASVDDLLRAADERLAVHHQPQRVPHELLRADLVDLAAHGVRVGLDGRAAVELPHGAGGGVGAGDGDAAPELAERGGADDGEGHGQLEQDQ
ncbi:hypothetical protein M8330_15235 [Nocardioides sp. BSK12Z-4]|uniref:Uncharacterized protein n=1 Tax=Nocardioides bruguierae TaxID=2945102 RepID=A0A9X2D9J1_9ACTN|nr:hypothetical protein [Nocardioides bruguierae]MCM0621646.1 hypothetical protein [Nocardioides bruguierae]